MGVVTLTLVWGSSASRLLLKSEILGLNSVCPAPFSDNEMLHVKQESHRVHGNFGVVNRIAVHIHHHASKKVWRNGNLKGCTALLW